MTEEEQIKLCREVFSQKWGSDCEDKYKFAFLNQEKGIDMAIIWQAYRLEFRGQAFEKFDAIENEGDD